MKAAVTPGQWRWLLIHDERPELDATARHVGLTLAVHADSDGTGARPTVDELARCCRRKRKTIRDALAVLEAAGFIDRHQPSRRLATRYRLTAPSRPPTAPTQEGEWGPDGTHSVGPLGAPSGAPRGSEWGPSGSPTTNDQQRTDDVGDLTATQVDQVAGALSDRRGFVVDDGIRRLIGARLVDGWTPDALADHLVKATANAKGPGLVVAVLRSAGTPPAETSVERAIRQAVWCAECGADIVGGCEFHAVPARDQDTAA